MLPIDVCRRCGFRVIGLRVCGLTRSTPAMRRRAAVARCPPRHAGASAAGAGALRVAARHRRALPCTLRAFCARAAGTADLDREFRPGGERRLRARPGDGPPAAPSGIGSASRSRACRGQLPAGRCRLRRDRRPS